MVDVKKNNSNNVVIVGAGLAGLGAALALSDVGYGSIDIVEKYPSFRVATGAVFGLAPDGSKAIESFSPEAMVPIRKYGIKAFPEKGDNSTLMLGWWVVRDALLEQVRKKHDKIRIHLGYSLVNIEHSPEEGACVKAEFSRSKQRAESDDTETSTASMSLEAALIVGADGLHSSVREALHLPPATSPTSLVWRCRVVVPNEQSYSDILSPLLDDMVWTRRYGSCGISVFNFHAKISRTMTFIITTKNLTTPPGSHPWSVLENESAHITEDEKTMLKALFELAEDDDLHSPFQYSVVELPDKDDADWGGCGRVCLIGDAAHALRPTNGQGGSMAFEDCVVLARVMQKLDDLRDPSIVEQAILEFESIRLPRVRAIWDDQWERAERLYTDNSMEPWSEEFEKWVFEGV